MCQSNRCGRLYRAVPSGLFEQLRAIAREPATLSGSSLSVYPWAIVLSLAISANRLARPGRPEGNASQHTRTVPRKYQGMIKKWLSFIANKYLQLETHVSVARISRN
jgi:hypothetical protein